MFDRAKGIAYCGLACAVCDQNQTCLGCRDNGCTGRDWCRNLGCCKARGLSGCWKCSEFPCTGSMLDKPRIRAFATFAKELGAEMLLDCLERNERAGIRYHYPGKLIGDYDVPETETGIRHLILHGKGA